MIGAVLFDLDDTLYPQATWLDGAWDAVAARATEMGVREAPFADALRTIAAQGTDQGRIIDRALAWCGAPDVPVAPLVEAFRSYAPEQLEPYPGVREGLAKLARRVPLGIVTDGDPLVQHAKLRALGFDTMVVVCSDELGREHRKPDPAPFERALEALGVDATEAVFVGDRPEKDVAGAIAVGMRAVRVRTGEYAARPDDPTPWASVANTANAIALLCAEHSARHAQGAGDDVVTGSLHNAGVDQ
jgi:putative hydrolase of the HAD superfamily